MNIRINALLKQRLIFSLAVISIYLFLLVWLDFLQGPQRWDEPQFWKTSLTFSNRLFPSVDELRDYGQLNTPLPFIIFGVMEYLFHGGIIAGRLLNLILSLIMVFSIGWPSQKRQRKSILCAVGLLLCPYYLGYSGLLYTDIIACFWSLIGVIGYRYDRYIVSGLAFVLAIASRQYAIAFPAAIVVYEFKTSIVRAIQNHRFRLMEQWKWLAPLVATLSIFVWFYLFNGLAPQTAMNERPIAEAQYALWALTPGGALNYLAFVGLYIVIPELILFNARSKFKVLKLQQPKFYLISLGLLIVFVIFPPLLSKLGIFLKISNLLPSYPLRLALFYSLALLTCIRFLRPNLISFMVLSNALIMMKAYPWDKYVLPLAVIFWYLKSVEFDEVDREAPYR
jgi:hypothetical protein